MGVMLLPWCGQLSWFYCESYCFILFSPSLSILNLAVLWQSPSLFKEERNILMIMAAEGKAGEYKLRLGE